MTSLSEDVYQDTHSPCSAEAVQRMSTGRELALQLVLHKGETGIFQELCIKFVGLFQCDTDMRFVLLYRPRFKVKKKFAENAFLCSH
jgi:hypothetical protein